MRFLPLLFLLSAFAKTLPAQIIPAPPQSTPIAIVGATAHLGTGTAVADAAVTFADGRITYAGPRAGAPDLTGHTLIDATGKDVYPGFIAMDTKLGLLEVDAVRATNDTREVGYFNPNARALIAFNSDSEILPTVRNLGVLIAEVSPDGGGLAGQSSAMYMDGWNWDKSAVGRDVAMHLHWPAAYYATGWWAEPGGIKKSDKYAEEVRKLDTYFEQAKAFQSESSGGGGVDNPRFRSMSRLFAKKQKLFVHATYPREIEDAVLFGERHGLEVVLVDARDAYLVKDFLYEKGVPVVCGPVHALPQRADDLVSQPFETPAELHGAGIPIAFSLSGAWEQRRLPSHAGHAVGFGLDYEEAVKALTLSPATMLGIEAEVGSLEAGKHATLFISEGDALDMRTAVVERAFIEGRDVDLSSRQTKLAEKYRAKYEQGGGGE